MNYPPPATEEEIRGAANAFIRNTLVHDGMVQPSLLAMVFLPLGLGAHEMFVGWTSEQLSSIVIFGISDEDQTAARALNGMPIFMTMRIWRREDLVKAQEIAHRLMSGMDSVVDEVLRPPVDPSQDSPIRIR